MCNANLLHFHSAYQHTRSIYLPFSLALCAIAIVRTNKNATSCNFLVLIAALLNYKYKRTRAMAHEKGRTSHSIIRESWMKWERERANEATDSEWDLKYSDQTERLAYPQKATDSTVQHQYNHDVSTNTARFMCIRYECKIKWWFTEMLMLNLLVTDFVFYIFLLFFPQGFFLALFRSIARWMPLQFKYLK